MAHPLVKIRRHVVLDRGDDLSHEVRMSTTTITWPIIDEVASHLGATQENRRKWRQAGRGVPASWRIRITEALLARGVPVSLSDFDSLPENPGRIAA